MHDGGIVHDVRCASDIASAQSQELAGQDCQECAEVQDLYATGNCTEPAPDTTGLCSTPVLRSWKFVQENRPLFLPISDDFYQIFRYQLVQQYLVKRIGLYLRIRNLRL